ncbi:CBS domain-containing protein [Streptomyces sp. NPDC048297]|uniref:CBS domain-containing protein n=1 Tax=Streptomyces sp. NPDC048297 TaxID=3365531 RepID=UPI00370FCE0F
MTTAADIMHPGADWIPATETLDRAAQLMARLNVGALPVSGAGDRLAGIITDRDIIVKCVAKGHDPSKVTCGDLTEGTPRWIDANATVADVLEEMGSHQIRRLPVIRNKKLVGMISEADLATHVTDRQLAGFVEKVYAKA